MIEHAGAVGRIGTRSPLNMRKSHVRPRTFRLLAALLVAMLTACTPTRTTKSGVQIDDSLITAGVKTDLANKLGAGDAIRTYVETFRGRVQLNVSSLPRRSARKPRASFRVDAA